MYCFDDVCHDFYFLRGRWGDTVLFTILKSYFEEGGGDTVFIQSDSPTMSDELYAM